MRICALISPSNLTLFYPRPLQERGSTDGHFLLLLLFLFFHTSSILFLPGRKKLMFLFLPGQKNLKFLFLPGQEKLKFLFLLGKENSGGVGPWQCMPSCFLSTPHLHVVREFSHLSLEHPLTT